MIIGSMRVGIMCTTIFLAIIPISGYRNFCTKIELLALERGIKGGPKIRALVVGIRREDG
jgi:hypothetical protein